MWSPAVTTDAPKRCLGFLIRHAERRAQGVGAGLGGKGEVLGHGVYLVANKTYMTPTRRSCQHEK